MTKYLEQIEFTKTQLSVRAYLFSCFTYHGKLSVEELISRSHPGSKMFAETIRHLLSPSRAVSNLFISLPLGLSLILEAADHFDLTGRNLSI